VSPRVSPTAEGEGHETQQAGASHLSAMAKRQMAAASGPGVSFDPPMARVSPPPKARATKPRG
jgi:hypothetical protein